MIRSIAHFGLPALCVVLSASIGAQTLYKSTMPDGRVIFSDTPAPGAAKVEPLSSAAPKTSPRVEATKPSPSPPRGTKPADPAVVKQLREDKVRREKAEEQVRAAEKTLHAKQTALAKGVEPLPGERIAQADGKSQLTPAYWARQRKLKDDVEEARANLEREKYRVRAAR